MVAATFKLIRTCMRDNWKRDFCLNFSFAFNFAFVSSPSLPSFTFNHNLSSPIFFSSPHFSAIGFFYGSCRRWRLAVGCGLTWSIGNFSGQKTFCHEAFFASRVNEKWRLKSVINLSRDKASVLSRIRLQEAFNVSLCLHEKIFLTENTLIAISCDFSWWDFT